MLPLKPCQNSCYDVYISGKIIINRPNSDIVLCQTCYLYIALLNISRLVNKMVKTYDYEAQNK